MIFVKSVKIKYIDGVDEIITAKYYGEEWLELIIDDHYLNINWDKGEITIPVKSVKRVDSKKYQE